MPRHRHFDAFHDHTRLKHFLFGVYLEQWAVIHAKAGVDWLLAVDAFAGTGRDKQGHDGSPLIAAKIARKINQLHFANSSRKGMRVLAIERDPERRRELGQTLA